MNSKNKILLISSIIGALAALGGLFLGEEGVVGLFRVNNTTGNSKTPSKTPISINIQNNPSNQNTNNNSQARDTQIDSTPKLAPEPKLTFYCNLSRLATFVNSPSYSKPVPIIFWNINNDYFGEKWPPNKRCKIVSERFQSIYDRDNLKYITVDTANWVSKQTNVICSVKDENSKTRCEENDLLITLETEDDPNQVLGELLAIRLDPISNKPLRRGKPEPFSQGGRVYYNILNQLEEKSNSNSPPALF